MVSRMSRTAVIVEGRSDQIALEALARRQGRDLDGHDISIVPLGGAQAIGRFLRQHSASGAGVRLGGICDVNEEGYFIRALGPATVEKVIEGEGELRSFRLLQRQPVQQGWTIERQLRRFISSHSGRKARYARLLVEALDLAAVPRPLASLVDYVFG